MTMASSPWQGADGCRTCTRRRAVCRDLGFAGVNDVVVDVPEESMPRERRRTVHYTVFMLRDGTVTSAMPVRKPAARTLKRDRIRVDPDGVITEYGSSGIQYSTTCPLGERPRFLDIFAVNLNTRRAIRALVLPELAGLREEVRALRSQLDRIETAIAAIAQPSR